MKRVVKRIFQFSILVLAVLVILAFVGVQPLSGYKDDIIGWGRDQLSSISLFTPAIPFDLTISNAVMIDFVLYIEMSATPNDRTEIGQEYTVTPVGTNHTSSLVFTDANHGKYLSIVLDKNSSSKVLAKLGLVTGVQADRNLALARTRLEQHDSKLIGMVNDYLTGRSSAPSYDTQMKMAQTRRVLVQDIASAENHLSLLTNSRGEYTIFDVSVRDVVPYLVITEEGKLND